MSADLSPVQSSLSHSLLTLSMGVRRKPDLTPQRYSKPLGDLCCFRFGAYLAKRFGFVSVSFLYRPVAALFPTASGVLGRNALIT